MRRFPVFLMLILISEKKQLLDKAPFNLDFGQIKVTHRKFLNSVCLLFVYNNTTRFCVLTVWFGSQHLFYWYWPGDLNQEVRIYKQSLRREMRCGMLCAVPFLCFDFHFLWGEIDNFTWCAINFRAFIS